ncbi:MAG: dihydrofolate reductase [Lysobacterales bacterium]|jgi:dihydrofolate reductase
MIPLNIIVAIDENNGIGKNGDLPWHISGDLKYFKKITTHTDNPIKKNVVVMGRKTWESIPHKYRPLPNRINVVLTRDTDYVLPEGVHLCNVFDQIEELLTKHKNTEIESVFIIGGEQIFKQALEHPACQKLYITHIKHSFECDTYFPAFQSSFKEESCQGDETQDDFSYCFAIHTRK